MFYLPIPPAFTGLAAPSPISFRFSCFSLLDPYASCLLVTNLALCYVRILKFLVTTDGCTAAVTDWWPFLIAPMLCNNSAYEQVVLFTGIKQPILKTNTSQPFCSVAVRYCRMCSQRSVWGVELLDAYAGKHKQHRLECLHELRKDCPFHRPDTQASLWGYQTGSLSTTLPFSRGRLLEQRAECL